MLDRRNFIGTAGKLAAGGVAMAAGVRAADVPDDMAIIRGALALHPGRYRYYTPAALDQRLAGLETALGQSQSRMESFLTLQRFLSTVRCGHTQCNFYNQSDEVVAELFDRPTRLPFQFAWIGRKMIVLADESGTGKLVRGTEILRINDLPASEFLTRLLPYTRTDGHNEGKRVAQLEVHNTDRFEYFDIYQGLLLPPRAKWHDIVFRTPDGRRHYHEFAAFDMQQRRRNLKVVAPEGGTEPFWTWDMRDGVAILTMPSWVMYNSRWDWRTWLDQRLDSLSGARGMVIDLRDNEGGNECGNVILSRLAGEDLQFPGYRQYVNYRRTPEWLDPYLDTWDRSFRTIGTDATEADNGLLLLPNETESTDLIPAMTPRITVPVAALISPVCSSATFSFARRAKESGLVRLFGETSGGNLRGINGGAYFFVKLPGSGIEFDVPLIANMPVTPQPDAGVDPDVFVRRTVGDIASGRDACMERAVEWVLRS